VKLVTEMPGAPQRETVKKTRFKRGAFYKAAPLLKISPSVWGETNHSTNVLLLT